MPRAGLCPARPSRKKTRAASRRAAARSSRSVARARSASNATAASGSAASSWANASRSSCPTSCDTAAKDGCRAASSARLTVRRAAPRLRSRRMAEADSRRWPVPAAAGGRPLAFPRPSGASPSRAAPGEPSPAGRGSGESGGQSTPSSSSSTDSGVRSHPSAIRIRPDRAACAASRAVARAMPCSPRSLASPVSSSTRSIAPRTDAPIRTSWCSRVARVSVTAKSTTGPPWPVTAVVISRSAAASGSRARPGRSGRRWRGSPARCRSRRTGSWRRPAGTRRPARTAPSRGTAISPSVSTVIRTLSVSSGTRLNSSRYSRAPDRIARSSGPSVKLAGDVPLGEHLRRVVLPDQPGRRELGVALGEDHRPARLAGDVPQQGGLAGARRALDHHVPAGLQRDGEHLALPPQPDDGRGPRPPGHGGSRRAGRAQEPPYTITPRTFLPSSRSW